MMGRKFAHGAVVRWTVGVERGATFVASSAFADGGVEARPPFRAGMSLKEQDQSRRSGVPYFFDRVSFDCDR